MDAAAVADKSERLLAPLIAWLVVAAGQDHRMMVAAR